jgi:tRNA A37 threonylcarbamoyltransferase TsaD
LHEQYGGVKPDVAQAAHAAAIEATVDGAVAAAGITSEQLSAVAVTIGPGLSLCLQVWRNFFSGEGGEGGGSEATVNGAIAAAGITPQQMLAVAVTIGPGLSLCLQVCVV